MTYEDMKHYIDICMNEYGHSLKLLVITGGECMIFKNNVMQVLKYATTLGLSTRIITNGFWGNTLQNSTKTISELIACGLKEINISTGDDHSKWIPIQYVKNIALASSELGLTPLINVETHDVSAVSELSWIKNDEIFKDKVLSGLILIEKGIWMPFSKNPTYSIQYNKINPIKQFDRCLNLFSTIPINPYGEVLACCGLTSENNPYLRLGNINKQPIKAIYESSFRDIMKISLFIDGPEKIYNYICELKNSTNSFCGRHICDFCRQIFKEHSNIELLRMHYNDFATNTILKYHLLTNKSI